MAVNQRVISPNKFNLATMWTPSALGFESSSDSPLLVADFEEARDRKIEIEREIEKEEFVRVWMEERKRLFVTIDRSLLDERL